MDQNPKSVLAWHFLDDEGKLRTGEEPPPDGEWLEFPGEPKMCECGLHASREILHALSYAPGSVLCRVRCEGVADEHGDKLVCRRRKILWRVKADALLRAFARWCALQAEDQWSPPDVVKRFLRTGEKRDAAWDASRDAMWDAAGNAADDAARAAAWDAAGDAARNAAWGAARAAAWAAASWDAAWAEQNRVLVEFAREARAGTERWDFMDV